jgi:hypothetical protein
LVENAFTNRKLVGDQLCRPIMSITICSVGKGFFDRRTLTDQLFYTTVQAFPTDIIFADILLFPDRHLFTDQHLDHESFGDQLFVSPCRETFPANSWSVLLLLTNFPEGH